MSHLDFEGWIKERLYDHIEPVEPDGWRIFLAYRRAKKRRMKLFRSFLYGTTTAAACLLLFILLRPAKVTQTDPLKENTITILDVSPEFEADTLLSILPKKRTFITTNDPIEIEEPTQFIPTPITDSIILTTSSSHSLEMQHQPQEIQRKPETRFILEPGLESYAPKRRNVSDGWSIALVSTYSNAAGETPFTPAIQVMSGRTRIFSTSTASSINQEQSALSLSPPISIGVNFQKELYPWLSIGLGINYTLLQSKFSNYYVGEQYTIRQSLHYVGIPVSALFVFVHQPKLQVYASTGGMVEKAVTAYSSSTSKYTRSSENSYVPGLQWSIHAGLGVEVPLFTFLSLYLEPGVGYFFDNNQPRSIRTIQPAQFKADLGLRIRI